MSASAAVIIRARDERAQLARTLDILQSQADAAAPEVILVDLGSRDGSPELAADRGATVVSFRQSPFSFGGALNLGARHAHAPILVALSAHAFPPDAGWLARVSAWFASDPLVACTTGDRYGPDGHRLTAPILQDATLARRHPGWGYGNAAGAFRRALWEQRPFREDLPGCEDKEWAWHWLMHGHRCAVDPALAVDHDHTHDSIGAIFTRARREAQGYAAFLDEPPGPASARQLARQWWSDTRWYDSTTRARLSHRRAARLLGTYAGRRQGAASSSSMGVPRA